MKSKWAFDVKRNGSFEVRLVACGHSQVLGADFTKSHAPAIDDVSWRILTIAMLVWKLNAKIIDVLTAFLCGDLEEDIHVECHEVNEKDEAPHPQHLICGLDQSARQHCLKFVSKLGKMS